MKTKYLYLLIISLLSFHTFAQPSNDNCSGAIVLTCGTTLTGQSTVGSTDNSSEIGCGIGVGVWYSYTAQVTKLLLLPQQD